MNKQQTLLRPYPFERLRQLKAGQQSHTQEPHIALSIGEPQHQPPAFVQDILSNGLRLLNKYPLTSGTDALKSTLTQWIKQRYHCVINTDCILPVNGSREALFALAQSVISYNNQSLVLLPNPFYQIYEGAALMAGAEPYYYDTDSENNFEPDWSQIPKKVWQRTRLVYTCSPGNPTGKVMSAACLEELITLSDQYDFIIAADECYSEIYPNQGSAPLGILTLCSQINRHDYRNCIAFNSLSKRSNLPGLRSGFVAGDKELIKHFLQYRTYHGSAMPLLTQEISVAAWHDEEHVIANRIAYDQKYTAVLEILNQSQTITRPEAAFFLWYKVPDQFSDESFALALFKHANVTVLPGSYLSRHSSIQGINPGNKYVRIALVAEQQACIIAAERIHRFITKNT